VAPQEEVEASAGGSIPKSLKSLIQSVKWEAERNAIAAALEKTGWNRKAAARLLGVSYRTMLYKIEQYRMSASEPYLSSFAGTRLAGAGQTKGKAS
jgi:DNA-binding NtrC family response regulator